MIAQFKSLLKRMMYMAIILFVIRCFLSWSKLSKCPDIYSIYGYVGEAITVATALSFLYERLLWKYDPTMKIPVLKKDYEGILVSSYDNKERKADLHINQTLLSMTIIMSTEESKSKSISYSIDNSLGEYQLTYCYINKPDAEVRDRSEIHYGTAILCINDPTIIKGQYFTDRKTIGDIKFKPKTK